MNNKLLRKLTLSAVTLGVAAVSLTTTTFAWFTTNSTVTASTVQGKVSSSGANMLAKTWAFDGAQKQIAVEGEQGKSTYTTVTGADIYSGFSATPTLHTTAATNSLVPVQAKAETKKEGSGDSEKTTTEYSFTKAKAVGDFSENANDGDYLHYEVIFAISDLEAATYTVSATFTNFTGTSGTQYLYVDSCASSTETGKGAVAQKTISVNLLDVLSCRVESSVITNNTSTLGGYGISDSETSKMVTSFTASDTTANTKFYRYKAESDKVNCFKTESSGDTEELVGDALTYYNNVYGRTGASDSATAPYTKPNSGVATYENTTLAPTITTTKGEDDQKKTITTYPSVDLFKVTGTASNGSPVLTKAYVKTDIYFFIDGWDNQCFNAVGGLSLSGGTINFSLTKAN